MCDNRKFKRRCVICGNYIEKDRLFRFTTPKGSLETIVNINNEFQGRSFYICKDEECLKKSLKPKVLLKYIKNYNNSPVIEFISQILNHKNY